MVEPPAEIVQPRDAAEAVPKLQEDYWGVLIRTPPTHRNRLFTEHDDHIAASDDTGITSRNRAMEKAAMLRRNGIDAHAVLFSVRVHSRDLHSDANAEE